MRPVLRRRVLAALVAVAALALAVAAGAGAATVTEHDGQGRAITFDVRASNVDVCWYASVLSAAAHGNEISDVTIRIVPEPQIPLHEPGGADLHDAPPPRRREHVAAAASESRVIMRDISRKSLFWPERAPHGALTPTSASQHTLIVH
jgi:hypothetical protein